MNVCVEHCGRIIAVSTFREQAGDAGVEGGKVWVGGESHLGTTTVIRASDAIRAVFHIAVPNRAVGSVEVPNCRKKNQLSCIFILSYFKGHHRSAIEMKNSIQENVFQEKNEYPWALNVPTR
jgi:hypothetical protein